MWKGDGGEYFCHGLTLGGSTYSVWSGTGVKTVLEDAGYGSHAVNGEIKVGDIVTWTGYKHSAIIKEVKLNANGTIDLDKTKLESKNGQRPVATQTFQQVIDEYARLGLIPDKAWRKP